MARMPKAPQVKLRITQEIIDAGMKRDSQHCMIAEALKVARPDAKCISVDLATIRFTDPSRGLRYTYLTPRIAQVHIVQFDQGRTVSPMDFQIRGGQVTKSGATKTPRKMTDQEVEKRRQNVKVLHEKLAKTKIVDRKKGARVVADRVGGKTPPLQAADDGVPFSRRRAFGVRQLEY